MRIGFILLFIVSTITAQHTIDLDSIVIQSQKPLAQDSCHNHYGFIVTGTQTYSIELNQISYDASNILSRQVFIKTPALQVIEHDASGSQMAIASRGLNPNRSWEMNVKQDGGDISADPIGYPEAYYTPPLQSIERIELYRGGAALQFGSQFGGLVNFISKSVPIHKSYTAELSHVFGAFGTQNSYAAAGKRFRKGVIYIYSNLKRSKGWRQNGYFQTYSTGLHSEYQINLKQDLHFNYTIYKNTVQQSGGIFDSDVTNNADTSYRARNWMIIPWQRFTLEHTIKQEHVRYKTSLFGNYAGRNSVGYTASLIYPDSFNLKTLEYSKRQVDEDQYRNIGIEHRQTYSVFKINKTPTDVQVGMRIFKSITNRFQLGTADAGMGSNYNTISDSWKRKMAFNTLQSAFFAELCLKPFSKLTLVPGIRAESIKSSANGYIIDVNQTRQRKVLAENNRRLWLFGIHGAYKLTAQSEVYGGITQNYRPLLYTDLYAQLPQEKVILPLRDAHGEQSELGFKGNVASCFSFDINTYFINYKNRIGFVYRADTIYKTGIGHSKTYGVSGYFEFKPNVMFKEINSKIQLTLFGSITFNNARYSNLNTGIKDFSGHFLEYAPVWNGKSGITIAYKTFQLQWAHYAQSLSFSDPSNAKTANLSATIGPLPGYQIHDLSLNYIFKKTMKCSLMVSNLCNSRYYTRRANGYPGPGLIPGMPRYMSFTLSYFI